MSEVLEPEVIEPELSEGSGFRVVPPAPIQEAIAGNAFLEVKNSLDAVWLHHEEITLPQDQSLCATREIAIFMLGRALKELGDFSPQAYTPSVRGWRAVAQKTLLELEAMGKPDHADPLALARIAEVVTSFLAGGHTMLSQRTSQRERKRLTVQLFAEIAALALEEDTEVESHGTEEN
jgi:hypothetical protein